MNLTDQLTKAAGKPDITAVRSLLAQGAPVNGVNQYGKTALDCACGIINNKEVVKLLIASGAEGNAVRRDTGQTPLYVAIDRRQSNIIKLLLANKAKVNVQDNAGNTLLHDSAEEGLLEIVKLLS